jgi:hypothetical protein
MPVARQPFRPVRTDWLQAAGVAVALLALYALSAPRSVALEDDGLFVLSSYFLGIEHPPGYPLFTLLGKLFTLLPFGSVAYRVHLASALFGALTCGGLWMCSRLLVEGRLPAYLAAFGLGVSPVFWSQSIIAEVYTLNTFFFVVLAYLGLRACPPAGPAAHNRRLLPWMAFVFGLSLSNHWPLMVLVAPAFAVLLWPLRQELVRRIGLLSWLVLLGLLPYAWMVYRSWKALPISFYGPLETLPEIWYFLSRAGYAGVDASPTGGGLDRLRFLRLLLEELLVQFAVVGTVLAATGCAIQWRAPGRRIGAFLMLAFLMSSLVLLLLLGFDYDSVSRHVFNVYPLPAYAVAALWMGCGFAWMAQRMRVRPAHGVAAGAVVLALIAAVGARSNLVERTDWAAHYASVVLSTLPQNAILFLDSDVDLGPIPYVHMIENVRPDITLYNPRGLVLGNRLFHPLRVTEREANKKLTDFIEAQQMPVAFTTQLFVGNARRERWLYSEVDRSSRDPNRIVIDIPEEAIRFFEERVLRGSGRHNAWVAHHQDELRGRYAMLLAQRLSPASALDERSRRHLEALSEDFFGALGIAEGLMAGGEGYPAAVVSDMLLRASDLMPADLRKGHRSKFFQLRGELRLRLGEREGAMRDFETAVAVWPAAANPALARLRDLQIGGRH